MKIIKKINNSAALALDSTGREIVVLGTGIGFPKVPYILDDLSEIQRTVYDISHLYPKEYKLGKQALAMLNEQTGTMLSQHEAVSVVLHLINAETENGDLHNFITAMKIMDETDRIIERSLNFSLDKDNYNYSCFATHMRYLIQRLQSGTQMTNQVNTMRRTLMREYPDIYRCALKVTDYFMSTWGWQCTDDEMVYLMMHIHRVKDRTS